MDIGAAVPAPAGDVEAPPFCRLVFAVGESTAGRTASESGAAAGMEGWGSIAEVRVDGESGESEGVELDEGCGPIKKVCVDDEEEESEPAELKEV